MSRIWKDASPQLKPLLRNNAEFLKDLESQVYAIIDGSDTLGFAYVGRVYSCRSGGCDVNLSEESASFEFFDYFFVANTEASILKVKVYNYQATHGHEVMGWGWLRQFVGYSGSSTLIYGKDIQAISGATISASVLTQRIQQDQKYLRDLLE